MNSNLQLPHGWTWTTIGEIISDIQQRQPFTNEYFLYVDIGSINRMTKEIISPQRLKGEEAPKRARKIIQTGDVLVSMTRPNLNSVALVPSELDGQIASTGFEVLRVIHADPRWIFYITRSNSFVSSMSTAVQGALYPAIRPTDIRNYKIPLAPISEQKRISDYLDNMFNRVNNLRETLLHATDLMGIWKNAILMLGYSGKLTKKWRTSRDRGIWSYSSLEEVCLSITDGDHQPPPKTDTGVPFITISSISKGHLNLELVDQFVPEYYYASLNKNRKPELGDVLFSVTGSIGIPVLVDISTPFAFQRHLAILKPDKSVIDSEYLVYMLGTENVKLQGERIATGTAQLTIPLSGVRSITIPLPPLDEQKEIVRLIKQLFSELDNFRMNCNNTLLRLDQLSGALIDKAFNGDVMNQDPNDEPASILLGRIRETQRMLNIQAKTNSISRTRMRRLTRETVLEIISSRFPDQEFSFDDLRQHVSGDYEAIKDIIFDLLDDHQTGLALVFNEEKKGIYFRRIET